MEKKVSLRICSARGQWLAQARRAWCCGPKKRLPVLTTHRWKALDIGIVIAVARLLFFACKKKVSLRTKLHMQRARVNAVNGSRRLDALGAAGLKSDYRCSRRIVGKLLTLAL
jgi:hypothetical protein